MLINNVLVSNSQLLAAYRTQPAATARTRDERRPPASSGAETPAYVVSLSGEKPAAGQIEDSQKADRKQTDGRAAAEKPAGGPSAEEKPAAETRETWREGKTEAEQADIEQEIERMKQTETKVITHEHAHKGAGGQYAGGISYERTTGPDGRQYITGGEVSIDISGEDTPQKTIIKMQAVKRAALAPADPSGQDKAVASAAASKEARARQKLSEETREAANNGKVRLSPAAGADKTAGAAADAVASGRDKAGGGKNIKDANARSQEPGLGVLVDLSA